VLLAQRWILACLRNRTFFGLDELNAAIRELLEKLNTRPFQKLEGCRRSAFEALDRPAMKPMPATRYELALWKTARVNIDYHFEYDSRLYSVPHTLACCAVEIRATATVVEALHGGQRVASHRRCYGAKGAATTLPEHRPKSHRDYGAWPPDRIVSWAATIGPETAKLVAHLLASRPHPEQSYRSCHALLRDSKKYGKQRMEAACARAIEIGSPTRKSVVMILQHGLDRIPIRTVVSDAVAPPIEHEHLRGADYFDTEFRTARDAPTDDTLH